MPNFEMPKMAIPAEFREFAENSASQALETLERLKSAAEAATDVIEETYATSTKGASDYGLKVINATRINTSAAFDFYAKLMTMKSFSDVVELATAHARKQFEAVTAQSKELAALTQKVTTETSKPMMERLTKTFTKVA
jgi:phasin